MAKNKEGLKLIYIHKIGYNFKGETLLEFLFSNDETNLDAEAWGWYESPASNNAKPPTEEFVDESYQIKINEFDLRCLHEDDRDPYIHGYQMIHSLAYETKVLSEDGEEDDYVDDNDDTPLLVFHYGISFEKVSKMLNERGIQIK